MKRKLTLSSCHLCCVDSDSAEVDLRCQHNTKSSSARSTNNTCCGAIMYFIPKRSIHTQQRESRLYHKLFKEAWVASYVEKKIDDSHENLDNCNEEECSPECYVFDCGNASEDTVEIECAPVSDVNGSGTSGKPAEGRR